eukprot:scaffold331_cov117-Cylindrotheca_fusiformis.AAC.2
MVSPNPNTRPPMSANAKTPMSAPPPIHSVLLVAAVSFFSIWKFPSWQSIDNVATIKTFTTPVLPAMSVAYMGLVRLLFATFILGVGVGQMTGPGVEIQPTVAKNSKLKPWKYTLKGFRTISTFTWWSFLLLGFSFLSSALITLLSASGHEEFVHPWLLRFAFLSFEASAPGGFLVSTVVRYALWPAILKEKGPEGTVLFRSFHGVVTHNVNVIFILIEVCLLGGLPVLLEHIGVAPVFGIAYILFTWFMANRWIPGEGPKFIYFFLDTTLGWDATKALMMLVAVLLGFYVMFANIDSFLEHRLGDAFLPRLLVAVGLASIVCRFRN